MLSIVCNSANNASWRKVAIQLETRPASEQKANSIVRAGGPRSRRTHSATPCEPLDAAALVASPPSNSAGAMNDGLDFSKHGRSNEPGNQPPGTSNRPIFKQLEAGRPFVI